jgi:hypothetical protein
MPSTQNPLLLEIQRSTRLKFLLISLVVFLVGFGLSVVAAEGWRAAAREMGSFLMVSVALAFLWEYLGKKAFLSEILAETRIAEQLHIAGIVEYLPNYHQWTGWSNAFETAQTLDIFAAYPQKLIGSYIAELRQFVAKGKRIRVILADPSAAASVAELAQRFGHDLAAVKHHIQECINDLMYVDNKTNLVEVRKATVGHLVKLVIFDDQCLLVSYSLRPKIEAPALVGNSKGDLYNYVHKEFKAAWESASLMNPPATHASPSTTPAGHAAPSTTPAGE